MMRRREFIAGLAGAAAWPLEKHDACFSYSHRFAIVNRPGFAGGSNS